MFMNKHIYILDNDANVLATLEAKLGEAGFDLEASGGMEDSDLLLDHIRQSSPKLIVLDIDHPQFDGMDLVSNLRADDDLSKSRMLVYTENREESKVQKLEDMGVEFFYSKHNTDVESMAKIITKIFNNIIKK
jgi:DNA-binding NarL/FixJ family response regulator